MSVCAAAPHAAPELVPGGTRNNLAYVAADVAFDDGVPEPLRCLLADAQTSGGLLLAVDPASADEALAVLRAAAPLAALVGRFASAPGTGRIAVRQAPPP